jgi:hypothetical protein
LMVFWFYTEERELPKKNESEKEEQIGTTGFQIIEIP